MHCFQSLKAMALTGVDHHFKMHVPVLQRIDELHTVLHVNIVVGGAVYDP